ncbi:hypothetical protein TNCV_1279541 [Trichonephila clavipes]|nr:hypothetical protein TNCV_1279541 [Trichonephila clavipes]
MKLLQTDLTDFFPSHSRPFGIVVSGADCGAVGAGFEYRVRHECLCCNPSFLCDVCFMLLLYVHGTWCVEETQKKNHFRHRSRHLAVVQKDVAQHQPRVVLIESFYLESRSLFASESKPQEVLEFKTEINLVSPFETFSDQSPIDMGRRFPCPHGRNYINILLSGAGGCGATSLIESFISICDDVLIHREFRSETMACQFRFLMDNHLYILRACDLSENTVTPPENHPVQELHYDMDVVVYLYSIDDPGSLIHLMELVEEDAWHLPCVLVGNKVDLRNAWESISRSNEGRYNFVSHREAALFAEEYNISWIVECSAKTGQSIQDVLTAAVSSYLGKKGKRKRIWA